MKNEKLLHYSRSMMSGGSMNEKYELLNKFFMIEKKKHPAVSTADASNIIRSIDDILLILNAASVISIGMKKAFNYLIFYRI